MIPPFFLFAIVPIALVAPLEIKIGGLFTGIELPSTDGVAELRGARLAIKSLNNKSIFVGKGVANHSFRLLALEDKGDGWEGLRAACNLTREGVHSIVGPSYSSTSVTVAKLCGAFHIPCISYSATSATLSDRKAFPFFSRVVAPDTLQASAIVRMVNHFGWKNICILHREDNYGIQGALATSENAKLNGINVVSMKSFDHKTNNAASVAESLAKDGCRIFITWCINCHTMMRSIFMNASHLLTKTPNMPPKFSWVMSDGCSGNMGEFSKTEGLAQAVVGSFCISPSTPDGPERTVFDHAWDAEYGHLNDGITATRYSLFAYDAVLAAAGSILEEIQTTENDETLNRTFESFELDTSSGKCLQTPGQAQKHWKNGADVLLALNKIDFIGATSGKKRMQLSETYERTTAQYSIFNLQGFHLENTAVDVFSPVVIGKANVTANGATVGFQRPVQWSSDITYYATKPSDVFQISSRRYKILTLVGAEPFSDIDSSSNLCKDCPVHYDDGPVHIFKCPNSCYWGLAFDVMDYIRSPSNLNFEIDIYHAPSGSSYSPTIFYGLLEKDFDIIVGDFTATSVRAKKVETSYAFYDLGLQIVMLKETQTSAEADVSAIFLPFKFDTWCFIAFVYITFASVLFYLFEHGVNSDVPSASFSGSCYGFFERLWLSGYWRGVTSPDGVDIKRGKKRKKRASIIENKLSESGLFNSMYWGLTSFGLSMDIPPVTRAGKIFAVGFMFCNVLILAIYTSVLASYFTVKRIPNAEFGGIDDVGKGQLKYRDICLASSGGSIQMFYDFKFPKPHQICYNCGKSGATYNGCYDLMKKGEVKAIIGDSPLLRYLVQNKWCDAELVGKLFYLQGFSFMGRKESDLIRTLTESILSMKEHQELERLDTKYFEEKRDCPDDGDSKENTLTEGLTIQELGPLWAVFGAFSIMALTIFLYEQRHGWKKVQETIKKRISHSDSFSVNRDTVDVSNGNNGSSESERGDGIMEDSSESPPLPSRIPVPSNQDSDTYKIKLGAEETAVPVDGTGNDSTTI